MINWPATKTKLRSSGRTVYGWARAHEFNVSTASSVLAGNYPNPEGTACKAVIEALRADGLLVEGDAEGQDKAA